jgi:hypothetical protein
LGAFDVDYIDPIALLFQSGYVTIKDTYIDDQEQIFNLKPIAAARVISNEDEVAWSSVW